jgi:transposase InsO family protein
MTRDLSPLRLLLVTLAGWVNRRQQEVINYLVEENRVLQEQLGGRRVRLTDDQRRRLAARGQRLGRRLLRQVATIVTPDTILRWHRQLIARKWTFTSRRPGRPGVMREVSALIVRMAAENPGWGYSRIQGALRNLDHRVARSTVAKVLKDHGIPPAPERPSSWRTFLRAHWGAIAGADFFTTEVWTTHGLRTYYTLFVLDLESRRVKVVGSTPNPDAAFMVQAARRLTDAVDGFLAGHRVLICDRDGKWTDRFRGLLEGAGVRVVLTPYQAPNANAHTERFVRSVREECLDRLILFGERHLIRALNEFTAHYHTERNHQGLDKIDRAGVRPTHRHPHSVSRAVGRPVAVLPPRGLSEPRMSFRTLRRRDVRLDSPAAILHRGALMHVFRLAVTLVALATPVVVAGQPATPSGAREPVEAMIIKVVPLTYARAGELAHTLSQVAPPRVRIVPYYPTNSLIISGPPAAVEQLIDIIKPSARD